MITVTYSLSNAVWTPVLGSSIAANLPDGYRCVTEPDGWRFYLEGSKDYAGLLWKTAVPMLAIPNPFTATLKCNLMADDAVATQAQALELDMMYSDALGNVGNGSGELQLPSGGIWQAIANGVWTNVPGFAPIIPQAEAWTPIQVTHSFDPTKEMSQLQSVSVGASSVTGAPLPAQPFQKLAWGPNQMVVQIQGDTVKGGGAFSFKVRNDISVVVTYS